MYKGSCLCGEIKFEVNGKINDIVCCHCSQCRRAQGSAFATNGNVDVKDFKFIKGEEFLTKYKNNEQGDKYFCSLCGSPIMSKFHTAPNKIRIRLGTIESDIQEKISAHIFVNSKANWETINDEIPKYKNSIE
ncbi:Gfa-like protein [hydrothermal vent metagenome]|uniref:Gfa-like protein n=1 Tax=hydrothermal vent metagenome TaxID=652676 RepID=A0A1W1CUK4_9ZZZZ